MEPRAREIESRLVCELLVAFHPRPTDWMLAAADHIYGNESKLDTATAMLCRLCEELDDEVIYNGRDSMARKLADWWDNHQEADKDRRAEEARLKRVKELQASAMAKLTKEEIEALKEL